MIQGIHHITLVVRDLDAAQRYYRAVAGMQCLLAEAGSTFLIGMEQFADQSSAGIKYCLLAGPNCYLLLVAAASAQAVSATVANPINRPGIRHFCVQNHSCSILEQAVIAHGGKLIAAPLDLGTGNQYAYARDSEGNIMEIEGLPDASAGEPTWFGHIAVVTNEMDQAAAFYTALFSTNLKSRGKFGPGPQFDRMGGLSNVRIEGAWIAAGNLQIELWHFDEPVSPPEPAPRRMLDPGYSSISLESDDLDADVARLVALGGKLESGYLETEQLRLIVGSDTEGNLIELFELTASGRASSIEALACPGICKRVEARQ